MITVSLGGEVGGLKVTLQSGSDQVLELTATAIDGGVVDMTGYRAEIVFDGLADFIAEGDQTGVFRWPLSAEQSTAIREKRRSYSGLLRFLRGDVVSVVARGTVEVR